MFEAATLAGVDLFVPRPGRQATLGPEITRIDDELALLPHSMRQPRGEVKDDF